MIAYDQARCPSFEDLELAAVRISAGELGVAGTSLLAQSALPRSGYAVRWTPGRA